MSTTPREPTGDECNTHAVIECGSDRWTACWYPQMGGYAGKCLVLGGGDECFDVLVWHDGEFSFAEGECSPTRLHHCSADQFVRFWEFVRGLPDRAALSDDPLARAVLARRCVHGHLNCDVCCWSGGFAEEYLRGGKADV